MRRPVRTTDPVPDCICPVSSLNTWFPAPLGPARARGPCEVRIAVDRVHSRTLAADAEEQPAPEDESPRHADDGDVDHHSQRETCDRVKVMIPVVAQSCPASCDCEGRAACAVRPGMRRTQCRADFPSSAQGALPRPSCRGTVRGGPGQAPPSALVTGRCRSFVACRRAAVPGLATDVSGDVPATTCG